MRMDIATEPTPHVTHVLRPLVAIAPLVSRIRAMSTQIRHVAQALGRDVDVQLFRSTPPRSATFAAIGDATCAGLHAARWDDGLDRDRDTLLALPPGPRTTAQLFALTADHLGRAATLLDAGPAFVQKPHAASIEALARLVASGVVEAAHACLSQLLVVNLACLVGLDPIPFPDRVLRSRSLRAQS
jgi:hypothetical protein